MAEKIEIIRCIVSKYVNKNVVIKNESFMMYDLSIDSLNYIKLLCDLEEILKIEISDEFLDLETDMTFGEFYERLMKI